MERVRKGQTLATLFAPDWLAPQNELLALKSRRRRRRSRRCCSRPHARTVDPDELVQRSERAAPRRRASLSHRRPTAWSPSSAFAKASP
jgi:Cu(I)/Ag(I) efflux system membrane fusion protein